MKSAPTLLALAMAFSAVPAAAQEKVLNLYTSRHYQTDEALYSNFTKLTGIKVNRVEAGEDPLIERMKQEGDKSPADVLITVDAGRLWRAEQAGLLQPVKSAILDERIPAALRHPEGYWYAFSIRARPVYYAKGRVDPKTIQNYEDLADPRFKGKICVRSGAAMYNLSLMSSMIAANGPQKAEDWAKGVVANMARTPKGGDTDQLKAVAAGECDIAIANTYYYVRLLKGKPDEKAIGEKIGVVFPNQGNRGAHVNISGAGVAKYAPHRDAAVKFLEYLASEEAQAYFATGNNEYPVVGTIRDNRELAALGDFRRDSLNVSLLGRNQTAAQQIYDRAGWK
jgi:iron(III) transport system substrate-binding protein